MENGEWNFVVNVELIFMKFLSFTIVAAPPSVFGNVALMFRFCFRETMSAVAGGNEKKIIVFFGIQSRQNRVSEFKRIAGVYYNRLRKGIKLQADPTVQFLKREKKRHNKIYYKDLEIDSPYNTYKYKGLPPGPINNPGKDAVLAALYPEENDYLFFVASGDGGHRFAKTKSEHERNVAKYRRWRSNNRKR